MSADKGSMVCQGIMSIDVSGSKAPIVCQGINVL